MSWIGAVIDWLFPPVAVGQEWRGRGRRVLIRGEYSDTFSRRFKLEVVDGDQRSTMYLDAGEVGNLVAGMRRVRQPERDDLRGAASDPTNGRRVRR